jgi:molybdopterin molybdotransferase
MSAMDGYAIRFQDKAASIRIVGESAAGRPFAGSIKMAEAVRIFTGAHMPGNADCVLIQEDATVEQGQFKAGTSASLAIGSHVRAAGSDFKQGDLLLAKGMALGPGAIAVSAMGGYGSLTVGGAPKISIIGSGDELVPPGTFALPAQIPSSNNLMIGAMLRGLPCAITDHGIAKDSMTSLTAKLSDCCDADIIVTSGGASVGDHDLVNAALKELGAEIDFWRVAIKPGKPVMVGKLGKSIILGLPGNPGSAFVTAFLFLLPIVRMMAGDKMPWPTEKTAKLQSNIAKGGPRAEFLRAIINEHGISSFLGQDSGLTTTLAAANSLIVRPVAAPAAFVGEQIRYLQL